MEVAPLKLGKSSNNALKNREQDSTPEEEYNDGDDYYGEIEENEEDEENDQAHPARAERVSLHPKTNC
jgi:hypothetical protein